MYDRHRQCFNFNFLERDCARSASRSTAAGLRPSRAPAKLRQYPDKAMTVKDASRTQTQRSAAPWPAWFALAAGGILALAGVNDLLDCLQTTQVLDLGDPLLGIPFRYLLFLAGLVELVVAWLCLFTNKKVLSLRLIVFLVVGYASYRIGLWTIGWPHPWPLVGGLTGELNVSPLVADSLLAAASLFLFLGSGAALWLNRRNEVTPPDRKEGC